jgi:hypothetical protein
MKRPENNNKAIENISSLLETLESIAHDFRCSDNAEWAREALEDAGYTFEK